VAIKYFTEVLDLVEFPREKRSKAQLVFRRVLGKSFISQKEMHVMLAFLRKVHLKLAEHVVKKS
ncbi:MAG: hypothetical protein QW365_07040, partial [Candidatus Nezhaarchaeales archaeon]